MSSQITLILCLKDREYYTDWVLNYLNFSRCPFKILIANGGRSKHIHEVIGASKSVFPNLDIEAYHYPYDETVYNYYDKMADICSRVKTPFSLLIDNDDIPLYGSIYDHVEFLCKNTDYSSSRGQLLRTEMGPGVDPDTGKLLGIQYCKFMTPLYTEYPDSIIGDTASKRISRQCTEFHSNWHNIVRTEHLQLATKLLSICKPSTLRFADQLMTFMLVMWGNSRRFSEFSTIHGTSSSELIDKTSHFPETKVWLLSDDWLRSWSDFSTVIATSIEYADTQKFSNVGLLKYQEFFENAYSQKSSVYEHMDIFKERCAASKRIDSSEVRKNTIRAIEEFTLLQNKQIKHEPPEKAYKDEITEFHLWYAKLYKTHVVCFSDIEHDALKSGMQVFDKRYGGYKFWIDSSGDFKIAGPYFKD